MNSGVRERGGEASPLRPIRATWRRVSISEWFALLVTWKCRRLQYLLDVKAFQTFFLESHFDFLSRSDSEERLMVKRDSFAAFVAPVVLFVIAYEHLYRKTASKCEVFLSFSGEDNLKNFADSLYKGMVDAGICVFRNDYRLCRDEKIGFQAIKSSKISIPILSRKYASKSRCLDELVQIMECKNDGSRHVVLPISYGVKPADIRCKIDGCDPKVVKEGERALIEISSLKRWELDKIADGDGGQLVELVVRKVLIELRKALKQVNTENLVGIESTVEKIMKIVDDSHGPTLYFGIYGEGGVGKTTLAKVIYNKLSDRFENRSFIPNIRESCECNGIEYLQNQLISDTLKGRNRVCDKDQDIRFISSIFKWKKILILLDDVDANQQLEALVGKRNWFASGSRIIITTRNKSVLDWAKVDRSYEHTEMNEDEAKILFARHAFARDSFPSEFLTLSHHVVFAIRRFPLILQVIGSYLCGKSQESWKNTREKLLKLRNFQELRKSQESQELQESHELQKLPEMEVQEILKMVYDTLEYEQKKIFLDIARFLVGSDARIAAYMWDASDSDMVLGIEELRYLSLIKIDDNHEIRMHDELRDLGRSIVCGQYGNELDKGSRLWEYEEAWKVLQGNMGTDNIRALSLNKNSLNPGQNYTYEQFKNLVGLRFLQVSDASFQGDLKKMFSKLRWFQWKRCPEILEAKNFGLKELAILDLSGSKIGDAWKGWNSIRSAKKLKVLNLTGCSSLESTFFLSEFKHLEILILRNCENLHDILPSIGDLETLVSLDLSGCSRLQVLPEEVGNLNGLKELFVDQTEITEIPHKSWSLVRLQRFSLQSCRRLKTLHGDSIVKLESLTELVLTDTEITNLPDSIGNLQNLGILNIKGTRVEKLKDAIASLSKLRLLNASWCEKLSEITERIRYLSSLQSLDLRNCLELQDLPKLPPNLTVVSVTCKSDKLPSFSHLVHLKRLRLYECQYLLRIPELPSTTLELEILGCKSLKFLTPSEAVKGYEVSLKRLDIKRCTSLDVLDLSQLNLLRVLDAKDCKEINEIRGLDKLDRLESLTFQAGDFIDSDNPISSLRKRAYYWS